MSTADLKKGLNIDDRNAGGTEDDDIEMASDRSRYKLIVIDNDSDSEFTDALLAL